MKTAAIIPAFNAGETIADIVKRTWKHVDGVIVVNDGSTDTTADILKKLAKSGHCTVLTHEKNRGKGEALRTAIEHLKSRGKGKGLEAVVFLDADGEHCPREIPRFLAALENADIVIGARTVYRSRKRALLNKWMASWFRLIDSGISDPSCGFRAVRWDVLEKLELRSSDFCIDAEMILEVIKAEAAVVSIPLSHNRYSTSSVSSADFLKINNFFDRWVLTNSENLRLNPLKRLFLMAGAHSGKVIGTPLLKRRMRNI